MSRFHIISIALRRARGDHAYRLRESFDANLEQACRRHVEFAAARTPGVLCSVLRDGMTGARYSLEQSLNIVKATEGASQ